MPEFASQFRLCREKKDLSRRELAAKLGISYKTVVQYEGGRRTPTFERLIQIADYFKVSVDYLVGRSSK